MLMLNIKNSRGNNFNRNIILCSSALSIPFTISLIEKFKDTSIIVADSKEIFKFFTKFYPKLDIIFIEKVKSLTNKNLVKMIKNNYYNYLLKKKVNFFFNKYSNSNVYTNIRAFSPLLAYILLVLSQKNRIHHQKLVKVKWRKIKPNFKFKFLEIYYQLFFGLDCHTVQIKQNKKFIVYSDKFFKKINAKSINYKTNLNFIKRFIKKNFNIASTKILLLSSGNLIKYELIEKKLFYEFMKKWSFDSNFREISLKKKNYKEIKYYLEKNLNEVPAFIPANLLIYNFKVVIGFNSATLFEAANKSCKSISLLYILCKDLEIINYYKGYLNRNLKKNKKVLYPKTFKQFINYIK